MKRLLRLYTLVLQKRRLQTYGDDDGIVLCCRSEHLCQNVELFVQPCLPLFCRVRGIFFLI